MEQEPRSLRFAQFSDTHVRCDERYFRNVDSKAALKKAVGMVPGDIDFLVHTGDLISRPADPCSYDAYAALIAAAPCPVWHIPGNHDDPRLMAEHVPGCDTEYPWSFLLHGVRFIGVDSSTGNIDGAQIERLRVLLQSAEPCVLFVHHHICAMKDSWLNQFALENAGALCGVVNAAGTRVLGIIHGHIHHQAQFGCAGVPVFSTPALSAQFDPYGAFLATTQEPPAFMEFEVSPDLQELRARVHHVEESHQTGGK